MLKIRSLDTCRVLYFSVNHKLSHIHVFQWSIHAFPFNQIYFILTQPFPLKVVLFCYMPSLRAGQVAERLWLHSFDSTVLNSGNK